MKKLIVIAVGIFCCGCGRDAARIRSADTSDVLMKDGNSVLRLCDMALKQKSDVTEKMEGFFFEGYLRGYDVGAPPSSLNLPPEVTLGQQVEAIRQWLNKHPEQLKADGTAVISAALKDAYPPKVPAR
jgi:hypothetical protein